MGDGFRFADATGPEKIVHIHNPALDLKAIVVIDNSAIGPAIGGTRMAPDVDLEECFRLARAMTHKNAAAGLPHGGAKSVIYGDPDMEPDRKERLMRAFAQAIRTLVEYVPGPDMGTDEQAMGWVWDEIGRAIGRPAAIGGIPLDEIGATGYGLTIAAEAAQEEGGVDLSGARFVVQGFGAVGMHAARFLAERGAILVAASDSRSAILDPDGLDVGALVEHKQSGLPVGEFSGGKRLDGNDVVAVACDIWIPAARPDVIDPNNVDRLDCRLFLEGANIPARPETERRMAERGILVIPDIIANAGGVICGAVEYRGGTAKHAFEEIADKVRANTRTVLRRAREDAVMPREAAIALAEERVRAAAAVRRWR